MVCLVKPHPVSTKVEVDAIQSQTRPHSPAEQGVWGYRKASTSP